MENASFSISPNPTNGIVYVKGASVVAKVQVINSLGQTVATIENQSKSILSIDLSAFNGLYLLKITDNSGAQIIKRVIVK